jgi:hypothetical protein
MLASEYQQLLGHDHGSRLVCCGQRSQQYLRVLCLAHGSRLACSSALSLHHGHGFFGADYQAIGLFRDPQRGRANVCDLLLLGSDHRFGGLQSAHDGDSLDLDLGPDRDHGLDHGVGAVHMHRQKCVVLGCRIFAVSHQRWGSESDYGASDLGHSLDGRDPDLAPFCHHLCDFSWKNAGCLLELVSESL